MQNPTEQQIDDAIANFTVASEDDYTGQFIDYRVLGLLKSGIAFETTNCITEHAAIMEFKDMVAIELEMYP